MFSFASIFISTLLLLSPRFDNLNKSNMYSLIATSSLFAYTLLGEISLIIIYLNNPRFPILIISLIAIITIFLIDKKNKIKLSNVYNFLKDEFQNIKNAKNKTLILVSIIIFLITIVSIGPINHPDSTDYHVGYPYQYWLQGRFFIDGNLNQGLLGIGDYANLAFIQEGNTWLIRFIQIITLPLISLFLINKLKTKFLIIVLLSSPNIIQWSTIGKPLFLGESVCALAYIIWRINRDKLSRKLLFVSLISCISIKISALIVTFPIFIDLLLEEFNNSQESNFKTKNFLKLKLIFYHKSIIISILVLFSILISRYIITDNFAYPLLTNLFNKDDILINNFAYLLSIYRRDISDLVNLFIPLRISELSNSIGFSFIILILINLINKIRTRIFFKDRIFNIAIFQILLLLLFCQGRGDYYTVPIILIIYSSIDISLKSTFKIFKPLLLAVLAIQLFIISLFFYLSINQTILSLKDYDKNMRLISYGYISKKYIEPNLEGNIFFNIGRDVRYYYPPNYISRDRLSRCLLKNNQDKCLENYHINQVIAGENYIENKEKFICYKKTSIKGSRNPLNRKPIKIEVCNRKLFE